MLLSNSKLSAKVKKELRTLRLQRILVVDMNRKANRQHDYRCQQTQLRSLLNHVPCLPSWPTCLTCHRALRALMPCVPSSLTCPRALRALVPYVSSCALVPYVLNVPYRILQTRSSVHFSKILYSRMPTIVKPQYLTLLTLILFFRKLGTHFGTKIKSIHTHILRMRKHCNRI